MLTCRRMMELITDYLEGRMPLFHRLIFQIHIGTCWQCRQYLSELRATIGALGRLPAPEPPPPAVMAELLERFKSWDSSPESRGETT